MTTIAASLKYYILYALVVVVGEKEKEREREKNGEKKPENANACVHTQLTRTE